VFAFQASIADCHSARLLTCLPEPNTRILVVCDSAYPWVENNFLKFNALSHSKPPWAFSPRVNQNKFKLLLSVHRKQRKEAAGLRTNTRASRWSEVGGAFQYQPQDRSPLGVRVVEWNKRKRSWDGRSMRRLIALRKRCRGRVVPQLL